MSAHSWAALYAVYRDADPRNRARLVVQDHIRMALERQAEVKPKSTKGANTCPHP